MEKLESSIEQLLSEYTEDLSYTTVQSDKPLYGESFSQLPLAIIRPASVVSIEGCERCRVVMDCEVLAVKYCLGESNEAIVGVYNTIRQDFIMIAARMKSEGRVIDISSLEVVADSNSTAPRKALSATVKMRIVADYTVEGIAD